MKQQKRPRLSTVATHVCNPCQNATRLSPTKCALGNTNVLRRDLPKQRDNRGTRSNCFSVCAVAVDRIDPCAGSRGRLAGPWPFPAVMGEKAIEPPSPSCRWTINLSGYLARKRLAKPWCGSPDWRAGRCSLYVTCKHSRASPFGDANGWETEQDAAHPGDLSPQRPKHGRLLDRVAVAMLRGTRDGVPLLCWSGLVTAARGLTIGARSG